MSSQKMTDHTDGILSINESDLPTILNHCVEGVLELNTTSGNLYNVTDASLRSQSRLVKEEALELFQAIDENEGEEQILKETIDVLVTVFGMVFMLNKMGYNVWEAWQAVNANNMTKFPTDKAEAIYAADAIANETNGVCSVLPVGDRFVIKDCMGKIRKPISYKKASVLQYTPSYKKEN